MPVLIDWVVSENEFANSADNSAQSKSKIWCNSVDLMRESTSFFLSFTGLSPRNEDEK